MKHTATYLLAALALLLCGCGAAPIDSEAALLSWMSNPKNGLQRSRSTGGLEVSFQYLPPSYLALREAKSMPACNTAQFDSLLNLYNKDYSFVMTLGPDAEAGETFDVMYAGVESEVDYNERVQQLNFEIASYLKLKTPLGEYAPVLSRLENTYGLARNRKIFLVFNTDNPNSDLFTANELGLTFNDALFGTGIRHYVFDRTQLMQAPEIDLQKLLNG